MSLSPPAPAPPAMDLCRPEEPAGRTLNPLVARWHVTGAAGSPGTAHHPATSLELFHTFALIRDEVMDRSATRRSRPTAHRVQASRYHGQRPPGTPAGYPATQAATSPAPSHASPDAGHRTDRDRLPDREIHRRTPPSPRGRPRRCRPAAAGCASGVCAFAREAFELRNDLSGVFGDPRITVPPVPGGAAK
ncbi:MAG TPA: polyprenyl synthetase family protein [Streptosporangiaceae bacterium]|nr:polyprenyl synthetase family protein [Streptosporangiaceae bacterium]